MTDPDYESTANRFRVASGTATYARNPDGTDGYWRDLDVTNPWLRQQRVRNETLWTEEAEGEAERLFKAPRPVPVGEMEFTTAQALVRWPYVIWDVNAYYAQLGVDPHATKAQIRQAYFDKKGWESVRLTYVMRQLLDPKVRKDYDSCRQGSIFFDRYYAEQAKARVLEDHRQAYGRSLDFEESQAEGAEIIDFSDYANKEVNLEAGTIPHLAEARGGWRWGYYLWKTAAYDIDKLSLWQQSLCVAFGDSPRRFCVGLMAGDDLVKLVQVGYHQVAFINVTADPTPILARTLNTPDTEYPRYP